MNWQLFDERWRERHDAETLQWLKAFFSDAAPDTAEDEYAWSWRRARLSHFLAMQKDEIAAPAAEVVRSFAAGAEQAKRAVAISSIGVEGHFWLGVNHIEAARRKGMLSAGAALSPAAKHIERAMQIHEQYHFGGPVRVWGRIQHMKPLILGGSLDRAIESFRRALQIAPHNSTTLLYYAEALWADRQPKPARENCEKILNDPDDPDWLWEQARDRRLSVLLLEKINRARDS